MKCAVMIATVRQDSTSGYELVKPAYSLYDGVLNGDKNSKEFKDMNHVNTVVKKAYKGKYVIVDRFEKEIDGDMTPCVVLLEWYQLKYFYGYAEETAEYDTPDYLEFGFNPYSEY